MRFTLFILSLISVSICELFESLSIFEEIFKLSCVKTDLVLKGTFTMLSIEKPLTFIWVSLWWGPSAKSTFHTIFPVAFIDFSVVPPEDTKARPESIFEIADEKSINVPLIAIDFDPVVELALEDLAFSDIDPWAIFVVVLELPEIDLFLSLDYPEVTAFHQSLHVELGVEGFVLLQVIGILILLGDSKQSCGKDRSFPGQFLPQTLLAHVQEMELGVLLDTMEHWWPQRNWLVISWGLWMISIGFEPPRIVPYQSGIANQILLLLVQGTPLLEFIIIFVLLLLTAEIKLNIFLSWRVLRAWELGLVEQRFHLVLRFQCSDTEVLLAFLLSLAHVRLQFGRIVLAVHFRVLLNDLLQTCHAKSVHRVQGNHLVIGFKVLEIKFPDFREDNLPHSGPTLFPTGFVALPQSKWLYAFKMGVLFVGGICSADRILIIRHWPLGSGLDSLVVGEIVAEGFPYLLSVIALGNGPEQPHLLLLGPVDPGQWVVGLLAYGVGENMPWLLNFVELSCFLLGGTPIGLILMFIHLIINDIDSFAKLL